MLRQQDNVALKRLASAVQLRPWPPYFQSLSSITNPKSVPFCSKIPIQACRSLPRILGNFFSLESSPGGSERDFGRRLVGDACGMFRPTISLARDTVPQPSRKTRKEGVRIIKGCPCRHGCGCAVRRQPKRNERRLSWRSCSGGVVDGKGGMPCTVHSSSPLSGVLRYRDGEFRNGYD